MYFWGSAAWLVTSRPRLHWLQVEDESEEGSEEETEEETEEGSEEEEEEEDEEYTDDDVIIEGEEQLEEERQSGDGEVSHSCPCVSDNLLG